MFEEDFEQKMRRLLTATDQKTDTGLADALGIRPPTIAGARKRKLIPGGWIEKIALDYHISADWLLFGRGSMRVGDSVATDNAPPVILPGKMKEADDAGLIMVPMVEAELSAGTGSLVTSDKVQGQYAFRSDFLHRKGNPQEMILMRVNGDSMQPEIMDHDVVLIDQSKKSLHPGPIYAVGFQDSIYLKRVDKLPESIILKSVNPAYPPIQIPMSEYTEDQFRVIGRVLWSGREYR